MTSIKTRAFLNGLTKPSICALVVALAVIIILFTATVFVIDREFVKGDGDSLLAEGRRDYDCLVTSLGLRLAEHDTSQRPIFVLLGASTTRASFLEEDLNELLHSDSQDTPALFKLCTSGQSLLEPIILASQLPTGAEGTVVLAVGPGTFCKSPAEIASSVHRLGVLTSRPVLKENGLEFQVASGFYFVDNWRFLVPRVQNLAFGSRKANYIEYAFSQYSESHARESFPKAYARLDKYDENSDFNFELLSQFISAVSKHRGVQIVFVQPPINPLFVREFDLSELLSRFSKRLRDFLGAQGIPVIFLNESAALVESDFRDYGHLCNRKASRRCSEALARFIENLPAVEERLN